MVQERKILANIDILIISTKAAHLSKISGWWSSHVVEYMKTCVADIMVCVHVGLPNSNQVKVISYPQRVGASRDAWQYLLLQT